MPTAQRSQNQNLIRIQTVLGDDALFVDSVEAKLSMSNLCHFSLDLYSDTLHNIQPKDLIGTSATFIIIDENGTPYYYNSYITKFYKHSPAETGQATEYSIQLMPWLHFLAHESDCRIFQSQTVAEVIDKVFSAYGNVAEYTISLTKSYPKKRYQVQYNETNLDFFNRICFNSGLAYYFTYTNGAHHLHIIDAGTPLSELTPKVLKYQPGTQAQDHLTEWQRASRYVTGNFEQASYNYKAPSNVIKGKESTSGDNADVPRVMETAYYQYIEDHVNTSDITSNTNTRVLQTTARAHTVSGSGDCRYLQIASSFSVLPVPVTSFFPDKGEAFIFVDLNVSADNRGDYHVDFVAVKKGELSYPSYNPIAIPGLQTAVVTGPKGEEIHMDPEGRIKVQFHWDRQGKQDENTTCWLRVMQSFAGPNFGSQFTPRIGQEVVVAFENGNPDRPFVIGALYHPENPPPYKDHKGTRNGIRTRSTKGGGGNNCNEFYFEDAKGAEEVFLQAEKDLNANIKHNETRKVGDTLHIKAGKEIRLEVGGSVVTITGSKIAISSKLVDVDGNTIKLN